MSLLAIALKSILGFGLAIAVLEIFFRRCIDPAFDELDRDREERQS